MKRVMLSAIVLLLMVSICACGSTATVSNEQSGDEPAVEESKDFAIGDEVFINTNDGEYKFVITGVEETSYRNQFEDENPDRVIVISYDYENISHKGDLYISNMNFKAYDSDNNSMDSYPANIKYPDTISTGRKSSGQMAFGLYSQENYVELEFYDNMFLDSDCKIILEW